MTVDLRHARGFGMLILGAVLIAGGCRSSEEAPDVPETPPPEISVCTPALPPGVTVTVDGWAYGSSPVRAMLKWGSDTTATTYHAPSPPGQLIDDVTHPGEDVEVWVQVQGETTWGATTCEIDVSLSENKVEIEAFDEDDTGGSVRVALITFTW